MLRTEQAIQRGGTMPKRKVDFSGHTRGSSFIGGRSSVFDAPAITPGSLVNPG
ncbi:MAG: hypothetical protein SangKO_028510 [Sandaracinaceae bacterium]